jgi:hypothetical protein
MARPTRTTIDNATLAWDALVNSNLQNLFDRPLAIALHSGDQTDLEATFASASYDKCLIWVDHTVDGWTLYFSNGAVWAALTTGGGGGGGGGPMTLQSVTTTDTLDGDENLLAVCSGGTYTVTLPSAATVGDGHRVTVKRTSSGSITIDGDSSDTIDNASTFVLSIALSAVTLVSDGTSNWHIV